MFQLTKVGLTLINAIGSFVILIVMMRFLLQWVRADFYNPISQAVVKITNPMLVPLRRIIPGFGGLDVAALFLAYALQVLVMCLMLIIANGFQGLGSVLIWAFIGLLSLLMNIYLWGLIIMVIASWVAPNSYNPALILIHQILEPVIRPIRRIMPDLGGIDFSPMVLGLGIYLAKELFIIPLAIATQIPAILVLGL